MPNQKRVVLRGGAGAPTDLERRLRDLQANQALRRMEIWGHHELDELRAVKRLAFDCFGHRGLVEADQTMPGVLKIGYYEQPKPGRPMPATMRPRVIMFVGHSHAELAAQVALWKARRA